MTNKVDFDPGLGNLVESFYTETYIVENDLANIPQFPRKLRYYSVAYKKIYKSFLNNLAFFKGCLGWAYYICNECNDAIISGNPYLSYTDEQKAQYAPTELIDFIIEYLEKFKSDIKYYHIKNVEFPSDTETILNQYREFISLNEGFINTANVSDLKLPENLTFKKTPKEIKIILDNCIENKNLNNLLSL